MAGDCDLSVRLPPLCFPLLSYSLTFPDDPDPAAESLLAEFLQQNPVKTFNMVSHIRYATRGEVKLENVHPFSRELWGINFCFAHNGDVAAYDRTQFACSGESDEITSERSCPKVEQLNKECVRIPWVGRSIGAEDPNERHYNPVGKTDSESIFCAILNALRTRFDTLPTLPVLYGAIASLVSEIVALDSQYEGTTILNFLLGVGPHIQFAYSWPGAREGSSVWNGLHYCKYGCRPARTVIYVANPSVLQWFANLPLAGRTSLIAITLLISGR